MKNNLVGLASIGLTLAWVQPSSGGVLQDLNNSRKDLQNGVGHAVQTAIVTIEKSPVPVGVIMPEAVVPIVVADSVTSGKPLTQSFGQVIVDPTVKSAENLGNGLVKVAKDIGGGAEDVAKAVGDFVAKYMGFPDPQPNGQGASILDTEVVTYGYAISFVTDQAGNRLIVYWRPIENGVPSKNLCFLKMADVEYFQHEKVATIQTPFGESDEYIIRYKARKSPPQVAKSN